MEKNTVLLQDTEAFMHGELDNVTVQQNCVVLDLVQGGYVPYGCYTSAPIPMPLFDALRVSWNAASPEDTAVEAQVHVEQLWQVEPQSAPGRPALPGARPRAALA